MSALAEPQACPHGCEDGWLYDWATNTASSCACRVPAAKQRKAKAEADRRYARARRNGKASGVARARRRPSRARRGAQSCARGGTRYHVRDISAAEFEIRYGDMCAREGIVFSRRGLRTAWELYEVERRSWKAQGQDFRTTNGQRQVALAGRNRARCRRTVQYTRKRLRAMGLVAYFHVRRGGAEPGNKDHLLVRMLGTRSIRRSNCTPPFGEAKNRFVPHRSSLPHTDLSAPQAADGVVPDPPPPPSTAATHEPPTAGTERGQAEVSAPPAAPADELIAPPDGPDRQLELDELKRAAGWTIPRRPRLSFSSPADRDEAPRVVGLHWHRHRRQSQGPGGHA